ncbi:MAG: DUF2341 domain-containing protein [Candidatus Thorarchaeota archaeon]
MKSVSKVLVFFLFLSSVFLMQSVGNYENSTLVYDTVDVTTISDASWLSGWEYRKAHNISGSVGAGTNYQVQVVVHRNSGLDEGQDVYCGGHCETDFADIRFTSSDGITELDYWLESTQASNSATFWIEVADNLDTDQMIFVYYGNEFALDASDGEATFIAWDDFDTGYTVGDAPKSSRGWFITDNGTGDILEVDNNPSGRSGYGLRYENVETVAPDMMLQNHWDQEMGVALHLKLYWDVRDGQFRYDIRDIDDEDSSVSTWSNYVTSYVLQYRDSPSTHLAYTPAYELLLDEWYDIESQCDYNAHSLIVSNTTLSGDVRTSGDGYDHIWIYGHEDQFDEFYIDDFFVRKFISSEPAHADWSEEEDEPSRGQDWLADWEFRKYHLIEGSEGAGRNYQVQLVVNYGVGSDSGNEVFCDEYCRPDFGDIRFTDDDGITELDYWMESHDSNNATFWVEVLDYLDYDQAIYVYFGNPDAVGTSNGTATFPFYEDWSDGAVDWSTWESGVSDGSVSFSPGSALHGNVIKVEGDPGANRYSIQTISEFPTGYSLRVRANLEATAGPDQITQIGWGTWDLNYQAHVKSYHGIHQLLVTDDDFNGDDGDHPIDVSYFSSWQVFDIARNGTHAILHSDDNPAVSVDCSPDLHTSRAVLYCRDSEYDLYNDWMLARKHLDSEPTHGTWGSLDSALSISSPYIITIEGGTTGNTVLWSALSYHPDRYVVVFDGVLQINSTWDGTDVEVSCDGLSLGTHNYTLEIFNTFGHSLLKRTYVRVVDTTDPVLSHPDDINYTIGSQGNMIEWTLDDLYPDTYIVYLGNATVLSSTWNSTTETVSVSADGFLPGLYNFTLMANDTSGNTVFDLVAVRVTEPIGGFVTLIIIIAGAAVVIIIVVIVIKKKK